MATQESTVLLCRKNDATHSFQLFVCKWERCEEYDLLVAHSLWISFSLDVIQQILHGFATFTIMGYFCEVGVPEIIVPMLMMEVSIDHLFSFSPSLPN
jgi:hypothetical protein